MSRSTVAPETANNVESAGAFDLSLCLFPSLFFHIGDSCSLGSVSLGSIIYPYLSGRMSGVRRRMQPCSCLSFGELLQGTAPLFCMEKMPHDSPIHADLGNLGVKLLGCWRDGKFLSRAACKKGLFLHFYSTVLLQRTDNGTKNRFHHLRRRLGKDFHRQGQKYSSMMVDRSSVSTDSDSVNAIQEKTRAVMKVLAAESKRPQYSHIKGYVFGPLVPVIDKTVMCKRCGLFIPSEQTGTTMCTTTEWCEACTRIPPYVALDQLRECLEMRSVDDDFMKV